MPASAGVIAPLDNLKEWAVTAIRAERDDRLGHASMAVDSIRNVELATAIEAVSAAQSYVELVRLVEPLLDNPFDEESFNSYENGDRGLGEVRAQCWRALALFENDYAGRVAT